MRAPSPAFLAVSLLTLAGCGGPLFFAEVADPRVCVTVPSQQVRGVPADLVDLLGERTAELSGDLDLTDLPALEKPGATTGEIELIELFVESTTDLSGVRLADVTLSGADVSQRATFTRVDGGDGRRLVFTVAPEKANLLPALTGRGGTLRYDASFTGSPPTEDWSTNVTACMSMKVKADLTKL